MTFQTMELLERAFPTISRAELKQLESMANFRTYPPEHVLCHEGEYELTLYLIAEGRVSITKKLTDRENMLLRYGDPGDFIGEMAIISDAPRSATVTTTEETTVLEIDRELFMKILRQNADLALSMVRLTLDRLRMNDKNAIEDLREAYGNLERLDKAKLDFIEVTAHELRTPLTIMRGYASMMLTDPIIRENVVIKEMVEGIVSGSQRLHEIVNNMLDVQRIDMDQLKAAAMPVSLQVVLRGVEVQFKASLAQRHITLRTDIAQDSVTPYIEADPGLLSKAMHHLLMNAIKYTPDGGNIELRLVYEDDEDLGRVAHITFADTGIGINKSHHQLIFEKFYRLGEVALHSSGQIAFKAGGPGLGLAIAYGTVMAHHGRIWVESEGYDETRLPGSIFHVMLPVKRPTGKTPEKDTYNKRANRL
jgi:signal transduction histidine kinase